MTTNTTKNASIHPIVTASHVTNTPVISSSVNFTNAVGVTNTLILQTAVSIFSESFSEPTPQPKKNHRIISMIFFVLGVLIMLRLTHL